MTVTHIEQRIPHTVSEVMCVRCVRRWVSVRPEAVKLKELVCPCCEQAGAAVETGERIDP